MMLAVMSKEFVQECVIVIGVYRLLICNYHLLLHVTMHQTLGMSDS